MKNPYLALQMKLKISLTNLNIMKKQKRKLYLRKTKNVLHI